MGELEFDRMRQKMVDDQIISRGVKDAMTIQSMREVPRHLFVPETSQLIAYNDSPVPIGEGQTISQPYIVALMIQEAKCNKNSIVLDIGTGSGYSAAIFSRFVEEVYTIERIPSLAKQSKKRFESLGYSNIHVKIGDGTHGWKEHGLYDAIVVAAGAPIVPSNLFDQLAVNGNLIIPVGSSEVQRLMRYRKVGEKEIQSEVLEYVRFVPLIGDMGWKDES
ncbi:MAG: protein-L-isoaspartate(D-aspartate) O-methyltransferase [Chlamydiota bacterium]|nr:protein-L-isoaspartate(D-aspartate) O-methyltransferase [Chlamydiota bacterium]